MSSFRKSTHSTIGQCVEVGDDNITTDFRKSSASLNHGSCVEAGTSHSRIIVRDTTQAASPERTALTFPVGAWRQFTRRLTARP